jgi:hypothetical protein
MKNQLFQILAVSLLLLSCQKQENLETKTVLSIQEFKTDEMVQELISYNAYFINNMQSPTNESIQLLKKPNLNKTEQIQLSNLLGFNTLADYNLFFKNQSTLANTIRKKYSFIENYSQNEIQNLLNEINYKNTTTSNKQSLLFGNRCAQKYNNCNRLSNIVYTAEILGCTATAIGIGAITGGAGGVFFQLACGGGAIEHLQAMRVGCQLDFEDCNEQ